MTMKKILITGGPTNEFIDEVMKITNMSTGSFSLDMANIFSENGYDVTLIFNRCISTEHLNKNIKVLPVETTEEMLNQIKEIANEVKFDAAIHAAAVGDYKADFSFLLSDLAEEIFTSLNEIKSAEDIYNIMLEPKCKIDNSSKISSYQKDLTVKLALTPKIISNLREWMPNTLLLGCKLLENVPKEELLEVAKKLCIKNNMDYIMANDLADLRKGEKARYLVNKDGFTNIKLETVKDVFNLVESKLNV